MGLLAGVCDAGAGGLELKFSILASFRTNASRSSELKKVRQGKRPTISHVLEDCSI